MTAFGEPVADPAGPGLTRVQVPVFCSQGGFTVVMVVDDAGALAGVRFATAAVWTPPDYADEKEFAEHEITVRAQPGPVGGTLTLPRGPGPWPGVVLLSGGGIFDRDGTAGPNKPLKDLAWGLASRGVAVLRFDKVTHSRPELAQTAGFTMTTEYVPHAVAAIRFLQRQLAVDSRRVFVVGHSMGGKVAPRVAAAEPSVAGLVLLAADAEPMHQAAVRVVRKLAALDPGVGTDALVETITRQAEVVAGPSLSQSTPTEDLLFGFPASYWLDLRGYDPVAAAAVLDLPMLLLQGGRDYQVTIEDDLARWQTGLAGRPDVTVRVHEAADHLFFPGAGPSSPSDYEHPHHVDPAVVGDIATWVTERESARNP
ncbi:alpha/beta hydrolase family protein [Amycolatopsis pittospori]|uniref:alpha/beta hydrolase family protein n=1 Tax=Amycolatopsis pittospori TaxID=2749434 RepID=UPI002E2BFCED|nr:alpha/beta fold hydrolase [Amycolatopsis pittospori]